MSRKERIYINWQFPGNLGLCVKHHCVHICRLIANKAREFFIQFERSLNALDIELALRCCMCLTKESVPITGKQLGLDGCHDLKLRSIFSQQLAKVKDGAHPPQSTYARVHSFEITAQRCLAQSVFHAPLAQGKRLPDEVTAEEKTNWFHYRSELMNQRHKFGQLHQQSHLNKLITLVSVLGRQLGPGGNTFLRLHIHSNEQSGFG